jgi:hypothetical protein
MEVKEKEIKDKRRSYSDQLFNGSHAENLGELRLFR